MALTACDIGEGIYLRYIRITQPVLMQLGAISLFIFSYCWPPWR